MRRQTSTVELTDKLHVCTLSSQKGDAHLRVYYFPEFFAAALVMENKIQRMKLQRL